MEALKIVHLIPREIVMISEQEWESYVRLGLNNPLPAADCAEEGEMSGYRILPDGRPGL